MKQEERDLVLKVKGENQDGEKCYYVSS